MSKGKLARGNPPRTASGGGAPSMDGKKHRVPVEGDRRGRLSGTYVGHLDGYPASYIPNFKTGEEIRRKAPRPTGGLTPVEQARLCTRTDAERAERESGRHHLSPGSNTYLTAKGGTAHGLRRIGGATCWCRCGTWTAARGASRRSIRRARSSP